MKDYNEKLEAILANKTFSKDSKNLLSSTMYKVENSYDDYKKTKVDVASKKDFLEELIEIINRDCREIEITKPNINEENQILKDKKSIVIQEEQKIVTYQNELALLEAIYELNTNKFNSESEDLNERAVFIALNTGEKISKSEIIRDFDGWSWNVLVNDIEDFLANLIYQSLVYLIGYDILNQNKSITLQDIEAALKRKYKQALTEKILKALTQISILDYIRKNPDEYKELEKIEKQMKEKYSLMEDKKAYIDEIANEKKKYVKEIEKIDKYINDDLALKKEYIKQNERLPQDQRVFSLSDFSEKVQAKRDFAESEIKVLVEKLKPQNYVKEKVKLEKKLNFINELRTEEDNELIQNFINIILKGIDNQIEKIETKKDIIDKIHILRYLKFININNNKNSGDLCKKQFEKLEKKLITIGCNLKALNIFSLDVEENYKVYKNIFNSKIIDLESAYIEISKENIISIFDENSLEIQEDYKDLKELTVKKDKKIKIFM